MKKDKKGIILFIGSIFVAAMFLSSMLVGGGGPPPSSPSKPNASLNVSTFFGAGTANEIVVGYGSSVAITLLNSTYENSTNEFLASLAANNTISTYNQFNNTFRVSLQTISGYELQKELSARLGPGAFRMSAAEYVLLPEQATLRIGGQAITTYLGSGQRQVTVLNLTPLNSTVPVYLNAIVAFQNGTYSVYNNNITLKAR